MSKKVSKKKVEKVYQFVVKESCYEMTLTSDKSIDNIRHSVQFPKPFIDGRGKLNKLQVEKEMWELLKVYLKG